ncbi:hypothetical protein MKEN_00853200 [Mycena kentingensis (nom. inval.)]|nr:hypothetical protein MKEN_00853200 [Mycena kentingensis (nom. inval.)]
MLLPVIAALLCSPLASAIQETDVGVVDWYNKLVGVPVAPPVFQHGANDSLIIVPTASNVLAALHASNGSVAWRYVFVDGLANIHVGSGSVAAVSGPDAATLRTFETASGLITKERRMDVGTGAPTGFDGVESKFLLNSGAVSRVGGSEWTWKVPENHGPYSKLVSTDTALYTVGHASAALHLAAIDPTDGSTIRTTWKHLPPRVESFVVAGDLVVWVDPATEYLGFVQLVPQLTASIRTEKTLGFLEVVDVDLQKQGLFVGVVASGAAKVLKVEEGGVIQAVHTFSANHSSRSLFAGGLDAQGNAFVARSWESEDQMTRVEIYSPGQDTVLALSLPVDLYRHGSIAQLSVNGLQVLITTSTGSIQLWDKEKLLWTREEGLAAIDVAAFVELPLPERVAHVPEHESFVARILRQIADAKDFPAYAAAFVQRFVGGAEVVLSTTASNAPLIRDAYGFRQILVVATSYGSVFGLDTAGGSIIWTRVFGSSDGGDVQPSKIFVINGEDEKKDVVILARRKSDNVLVETALFRIDPLTGRSLDPVEEDTEGFLEGKVVLPGPLLDAYLIPNSDTLLLVDELFQILPYPESKSTEELVGSLAPNLFLPFLESSADGPRVVGHGLRLDTSLADRHVAYQTWALNLPPGQVVQRLVRPRVGPVVSYGKVLGNRTTLYKYLNPRMFVVLTESTNGEFAEPGCGLYVVDGAKGSVLYSVVVPSAGKEACDVQATLTENWLVYHYYDGASVAEGETKGWKVVTVELYEGALDEKTQSSELSAFSPDIMRVVPLEQSYLYPHAISALTTTNTKFGITTKDIILATQNHKIQQISRRLLNPRRPKDRKPTAEEQQEEQLVPYDLLLADDPKRTISHAYEVRGTRAIVTAPALLESTSLVFAYGLDLFFTRVAPSNTFDILSASFNKAQLVLTVAALAAGIAVTKPMVRKKRLRERWYQ